MKEEVGADFSGELCHDNLESMFDGWILTVGTIILKLWPGITRMVHIP